MTQLPCGFCSKKVYAMDLFSHAMTDHPRMIAHLQEEAAQAWAQNPGSTCGLKVGGVVCGKPAVVLATVRIPTLIRSTRLHNPTRGKDAVVDTRQKLCGDHAVDLTARDVLDMLGIVEQIEANAATVDLALDWLGDNSTGGKGAEIVYYPLVEVTLS